MVALIGVAFLHSHSRTLHVLQSFCFIILFKFKFTVYHYFELSIIVTNVFFVFEYLIFTVPSNLYFR
jgi:hypothetical protein